MTKVSDDQWSALEAYVLLLLQGKASLIPKPPSKKRIAWPGEKEYGREKVERIRVKLENTDLTAFQIAKQEGVTRTIVNAISNKIFHAKKTGPRNVKRHDSAQKHDYFSEEQIQHFLEQHRVEIDRAVNRLWGHSRSNWLFPDKIAVQRNLIARLRRRLAIFNPRKGNLTISLGKRIDKYVAFAIRYSGGEIKKNLDRRKKAGALRPLARIHYDPPVTNTESLTSLQNLVDKLTQKGLTKEQRIVLFAKIAGMEHSQIGSFLGLSQARISDHLKPARKIFGDSPLYAKNMHKFLRHLH